MSDHRLSEAVEKEFNVKLPEDYRDFIDTHGYLCLENLGLEIYGHQSSFCMTKIPSVVAATRLYCKDYDLEKKYIVISHTGFEDYIIILDIYSDEVSEINTTGDKKIIAKSFQEWFDMIKKKDMLSA